MPAAEKNHPRHTRGAGRRACLPGRGPRRARPDAQPAPWPWTPTRPAAARCPASTSRARCYYRAQALIDDPETPLFFGRLDMSSRRPARAGARDDVLRRPAPRARRRRRPRRGRLAGRRVPRVLPRDAHRADGRRAPPPVRLRTRHDHGLRGRAPAGPARGRRAAQPHPGQRDRAAARRADARHRRDDPARAGRHRARRRQRDRVRAGRARAPGRPRSACTARRTSSTPSATGCAAVAC